MIDSGPSGPTFRRRNSADTWLEEQSIITDSDFKEELDIEFKIPVGKLGDNKRYIDNKKYLTKLIVETQNVRKRSKTSFVGFTSKFVMDQSILESDSPTGQANKKYESAQKRYDSASPKKFDASSMTRKSLDS